MKYEILKLLKEAGPDHVTGVDIGARFGISRSAVWKHIKELRNEGYDIESSPNLGYRLLAGSGLLNAFEITDGLGTMTAGREVVWFDRITSTNIHAAGSQPKAVPRGRPWSRGCRPMAKEGWAGTGNPRKARASISRSC